MREKKGITLVALVVTIIVLIILAGVSISLVLGDNGIVTKAKLAKERTQQAKINEEENMNSAVEYIENLGENREPKFSMIDGIPIPRGFEHVEGTTKETGFVIRDNSRNATQGNEFVWVPCSEDGSNGIKYDRYAFSREGWQFSQVKDETTGIIDTGIDGTFKETMSEIEFNSVKKYGGFYIGRYETGIEGYDAEIEKENTENKQEWTGYTNGIAVVQKDKQVWNYITREKARKVAEAMYQNNTAVTSRLCSSYAWDTALKFIEIENPGYATNSIQDNYSGSITNTGEGSTAVSNIYDMGGNIGEWTTETSQDDNSPCALRWGIYVDNATMSPASRRISNSSFYVHGDIGFRVTIYLEL